VLLQINTGRDLRTFGGAMILRIIGLAKLYLLFLCLMNLRCKDRTVSRPFLPRELGDDKLIWKSAL
jgi:hypothetical protein